MQKGLSFPALRSMLAERFLGLVDQRQEGKIIHSVHDVFMSAFAMMFFQDPSLLQFQKRLEEEIHTSNLKTLFHVSSVPGDTAMRGIIDACDSEALFPLFDDFFRPLQRGKHLEAYRVLKDHYAITIDGSGYFSSEKIACPSCLRKTAKGRTLFEHWIVQAALVHPAKRQVIPLAPEEVRNTDGTQKQDCEAKAALRLIERLRSSHPRLKGIVVADSLYSKQPFIEALVKEHLRYVLVAKEEDHKVLTEYVKGAERSRLEVKDLKGRLHVYEWIDEVPLNGNDDAPSVNWFSYELHDKGKRTYHNTWVTDLPVSEKNIEEFVRIGRARWKIENETFNTLKNQGYHIEHNFGHGVRHLSFNFFLLNLLAFFMHQIFELTDDTYQALREKYGSKRNLWDHLRASLNIVLFPDWETFFQRLLTPSRYV
jgi:hypothetical protein